MTVTAEIQARRRTTVDAYGTSPRTVVARPPSDADPDPRFMVVYISGSPVLRPYDNEIEQP